VINIITKNSAQTQGLLVKVGGGSLPDLGAAAVRYGGSNGSNFTYRGYGKFRVREGSFRTELGEWRMGQAGFRTDWSQSPTRILTVQGDLYEARDRQSATIQSFDPPYTIPGRKDAPLAGGNILTRWTSPWKFGSDIRLQLYYDRTSREDLTLTEKRNTFDIDFQNALPARSGHQLVWIRLSPQFR
jgi:iron complex outermembrane receptor protein